MGPYAGAGSLDSTSNENIFKVKNKKI